MDILNILLLVFAGLLGGLCGLFMLFSIIAFFSYLAFGLLHHYLVRYLFNRTFHIKWMGVIIEILLLSVICFFGHRYLLNLLIEDQPPTIVSILVASVPIVLFLIMYIFYIKYLSYEKMESIGGHYYGDWDGDMGQDM